MICLGHYHNTENSSAGDSTHLHTWFKCLAQDFILHTWGEHLDLRDEHVTNY